MEEDRSRFADEPLDAALFEGWLLRDDDPGGAVEGEDISDLRQHVLAVADALLPARVLHDDFVYRHCSWAGPGGARPGSRQQINC
jgi:hypothetical protein